MLQIVLFEEVSLCLNDRVQKLFCFFTHKFEQHLFSVFSSIRTFNFDQVLGSFLTYWDPNGQFFRGWGRVKNCFGVYSCS